MCFGVLHIFWLKTGYHNILILIQYSTVPLYGYIYILEAIL